MGAEGTLSPDEKSRWTRIGLLAALAMALGYLETFIPIPIPGVKLGLANIAVLLALARHDIVGAFCVGLVKVLAAGLLFGNPLTMAFSAAGTLTAFLVMAPLSSLRTMRLEMTSVAGAVAHEMGQLAVAGLVLGSPLVWYSAPMLLIAGCVTGAVCGIIAARTAVLLERQEAASGGAVADKAAEAPPSVTPLCERDRIGGHPVNATAAIVVFLVYCLVALHAATAIALAACLALSAIACLAAHVRMSTVIGALRPLAVLLVITLIAQVAGMQQGDVITWLGSVAITREALIATSVMFARLLGITAASIALMSLVGTRELARSSARMMSPLRRIGIRTEGFAWALQVALQAVPLLAHAAEELLPKAKGDLFDRGFWETTVPQLIASMFWQAQTLESLG